MRSVINPIGLYIHIPFCHKKCDYCDFYSVIGEDGMIDDYVDAVITEINSYAAKGESQEIATIFLGGGTPSLLSPHHVDKILDSVGKKFSVREDAEITIEMNPESVTKEKIDGYSDAGVNRGSLGFQALSDERLATLGRIHDLETSRKAYALLRNNPTINTVSIDLIYGTEGHSEKLWRDELKQAIDMAPDHLSVYELTPEKGTPLYNKVLNGAVDLDRDNDTLYEIAESALYGAGYDHYEISNYAKPGYECHHNLGYWQLEEYIGVGASASGFLDDRRWTNIRDVRGYIKAVNKSGAGIDFEERVTDEMNRTERLMMGLRLKEGIDIENIVVTPKIKAAIDKGDLAIENGRIRATEKSWRLLDSLLTQII